MTPSSPSSSLSPLARIAPYRRPVFSFGGALLIGYFLFTPLLRPAASKGVKNDVSPLLLPASATMIVRPKAAVGARVEGKVTLAADVIGRAPVGGAVARWLVEPGQRVRKGQPVVQISSGTASKPAPVAEFHQTRAERAQIEAAQGQMELARQMSQAQTQLRGAQERVKRAQVKVAEARALISQLQSQENSPPQNSAPAKPQLVPNPAHAAAEAELKEAQGAASEAKAALKIAESGVKTAQKSLAEAQKNATKAELKVGQVERDFDAGKITGGDVQSARSDKEDALTRVQSATVALESAKKELELRTKAIAPLTAKIESAQKILAATPETIEGAVDSAPQGDENAEQHNSAALGEAIQRAQKALEESRQAAREAERLAIRVKSYESRAHQSNREIESATEQLENAQQRVLESVPRPVFTEASAPQSGTVVWISRLATEVGPGDRVFGVSLGDRYKVRLEVSGEDWKRVQVGDKLPAILSKAAPNEAASGAATSEAATTPAVLPAPATQAVEGATFVPGQPQNDQTVPVRVVVREIKAPENGENKVATIEGDLEILADSPVSPSESLEVSAFLPAPGAAKMRVPLSSLVAAQNKTFVALLREDQNSGDQVWEMTWKQVTPGKIIGDEREVEGLPADSRILTQPLSTLPDATPSEGRASRVAIHTS